MEIANYGGTEQFCPVGSSDYRACMDRIAGTIRSDIRSGDTLRIPIGHLLGHSIEKCNQEAEILMIELYERVPGIDICLTPSKPIGGEPSQDLFLDVYKYLELVK